ncbi:MAG: hypothetical protein HKM24_06665, partial [Gammaproteobacteria bacterium]|nr:hypothetical protein [Gammaproteobacteria bacterium]
MAYNRWMYRGPNTRALIALAFIPLLAQSAIIQRSITVDGTMTDWTTPTDITNNPGQFSTDGPSISTASDLDHPVASVGRDLKKFSFTYDNTYLYFWVERYASSSNVTDWWFFIDNDNDSLMETGEDVLRVKWRGSNGKT